MIQKFLQTYKEAFGNAVPLPVTFGYSHIPVTEINKIPRCMIGSIRKAKRMRGSWEPLKKS